MMGDRQSQKSGDLSTNVQAGGNVTVGLNYSEARQVAMDVFEANFLKLKDEAFEVARERAEQFIESFLTRAAEEGQEEIPEAKNPDFQYAVFSAQREYARTGDEDLGELLVQLLVDRTKTPERNLMQIVLNESLSVAPKLTQDQLDALSLIFLLRYTKHNGLLNLDSLGWYLDHYISPFVPGASRKDSAYQHLEFAGCGTVSVGEIQAEAAFAHSYPGLFCKGFTEAEVEPVGLVPSSRAAVISDCLHDDSLLQVNAVDDDSIYSLCARTGVEPEKREKLTQLQNSKVMSSDEIKTFLSSTQSQMPHLFDLWNSTPMKNMTLTSVGIAVAHANIQKQIGEKFDLSIWL